MLNSRFGYSMKKNSFKGLNIDCIQYSNIIRITYYSYSYSGTILNPNIIRIRIRPNICARILFVFVFAHFEKTNIIRIRIRSKFWFRIIFVFVFGPKNSIRSPLIQQIIQGVFFYWSALKMTKCQTLRKFWLLEPLGADQSKKNTLYIRFGVKPQEKHLFLAAVRRTQQRKETKPTF